MKINRTFCPTNANIFRIKPIKEFVERNIIGCKVIVNLFVNSAKHGTILNDLNPDFGTHWHLDALDLLKIFDDKSVDCVLYSPPCSSRQVIEVRNGVGREISTRVRNSA